MARFRMKYKGRINIGRVVAKIGATILALWVGGVVLQEIGTAAIGECSPFFSGLSLIGWESGDATAYNASTALGTYGGYNTDCESFENILNDTSEAGILSVVGLIGIAAIIMEFVTFKFNG